MNISGPWWTDSFLRCNTHGYNEMLTSLRDCIKTLSSLSIQDAFNVQNLIFFTSIQQVSKFPLHVVTYIHEWRTWKMKNVLNSDPARIQTKLWPVRTIGNLSSRITDIKDKKNTKQLMHFNSDLNKTYQLKLTNSSASFTSITDSLSLTIFQQWINYSASNVNGFIDSSNTELTPDPE